jgi:hypothetical protein
MWGVIGQSYMDDFGSNEIRLERRHSFVPPDRNLLVGHFRGKELCFLRTEQVLSTLSKSCFGRAFLPVFLLFGTGDMQQLLLAEQLPMVSLIPHEELELV